MWWEPTLEFVFGTAVQDLEDYLRREKAEDLVIEDSANWDHLNSRYMFRYDPVCEEVLEIIAEETKSRGPEVVEPPDTVEDEAKRLFRDADSFEVLDDYVKLMLRSQTVFAENPKAGRGKCKCCFVKLEKKTRQYPKFCPRCAKMRKYASMRQARERYNRLQRAKRIKEEYEDKGWDISLEDAIHFEEYVRTTRGYEDALRDNNKKVHYVDHVEAKSVKEYLNLYDDPLETENKDYTEAELDSEISYAG